VLPKALPDDQTRSRDVQRAASRDTFAFPGGGSAMCHDPTLQLDFDPRGCCLGSIARHLRGIGRNVQRRRSPGDSAHAFDHETPCATAQ
jgi:hypothetical protein